MAESSNLRNTTRKYKQTSHEFIARYNGPDPSKKMTPDQAAIRDSIIASRPRTGISGPFGPWISIPAIAKPAQELGRVCRYETSLSFRESELVILLTGAKHQSHAEFDIHVGEAVNHAGIPIELVEAIPRDQEFSVESVENSLVPLLKSNSREVAIVRFVSELLDNSGVSDETYNATKNVVGDDSVLVEITSIVGYYTYCAYTLNVFRIPSTPVTLQETNTHKN